MTVRDDDDRARWNARYAERGPAIGAPDAWLLEIADDLPATGRALDLAGGSGRHALWLARRGLEVTLADVSDVALDVARAAARAEGLALRCVRTDLTREAAPAGPWDLILAFRYLQRDLYPRFPGLLAPGGVLVSAHPTRTNLERHAAPSARFLLAEGELPGLAAGLVVERLAEGWTPSGLHEARLLARQAP